MPDVVVVTCDHCQAVMPSGLRVCGECGRPFIHDYTPPRPLDNAVIATPAQELAMDESPTTRKVDGLFPVDTGPDVRETLERSPLASSSPEFVHEASWSTSASSNAGNVVNETIIAELVVDDAKHEPTAPVHTGVIAVRESSSRRTRRRGLARRTQVLVIAGGAVLILAFWGCVALGAGMMASQAAAGAGTDAITPSPAPSTTAHSNSTATLPGFETRAAWSTPKISAAAAAGDHVLSVSGTGVEVRDVATGKVVSSTSIAGADVRAVSGFVSGTNALAAVSDSQALVWVDGADAPLTIALEGGRSFEVRSGAFVVAGSDRAFWIVTAAGEVPVTAPHPQSIVLGVTGESVIWAAAPHQVTIASPNGAIVADVTLVPPAPDATITPRVGWVRAATGTTIVVGWTLADGSTVTGVHATATGAVVSSFPGVGDGILSPEGDAWLADGQLVDLTAATVTALPDGFVSAGGLFLGDALYGAIATGGDALLQSGKDVPEAVPASTVRPFAIANPGDDDAVLLTLTSGSLAAYMTSEKK